jgi:hypothetical protein
MTVYGLPAAAVDAIVPVIWPVVAFIDRPVGRPVAAYVRGSLSASVAEIAKSTMSPSALVWSPGAVTTGGLLLGAAPVVNVHVGLVRFATPSLVTANHS